MNPDLALSLRMAMHSAVEQRASKRHSADEECITALRQILEKALNPALAPAPAAEPGQ